MDFKVGERALLVCKPSHIDLRFIYYVGTEVTIASELYACWCKYHFGDMVYGIKMYDGRGGHANPIALQKLPPDHPRQKCEWDDVKWWQPSEVKV